MAPVRTGSLMQFKASRNWALSKSGRFAPPVSRGQARIRCAASDFHGLVCWKWRVECVATLWFTARISSSLPFSFQPVFAPRGFHSIENCRNCYGCFKIGYCTRVESSGVAKLESQAQMPHLKCGAQTPASASILRSVSCLELLVFPAQWPKVQKWQTRKHWVNNIQTGPTFASLVFVE